MTTTAIARLASICVVTMTGVAVAETPHFEYSGDNGPANWSRLSPDFTACQSGRRQSPVNVAGAQDVELPELDLHYRTLALDFLNNGHTVQVNYPAGSTLADSSHDIGTNDGTIGRLGSTFELRQFHFHSPSEHRLNGKNTPAELHFVHADQRGNLAVIGVFVTEGAAHPVISRLWQALPREEGEDNKLDQPINAYDLLPTSKGYVYYQGSLTTPPCTEGVHWLVMKETIMMSSDQISALKRAIGFDNNRPVQALNGRAIFE